MQVVIGALLLAIPVSLTEEAWVLGATLPWMNVLSISFISLVMISIFVFYNFYKVTLKGL